MGSTECAAALSPSARASGCDRVCPRGKPRFVCSETRYNFNPYAQSYAASVSSSRSVSASLSFPPPLQNTALRRKQCAIE
eukprot:5658809-Prymnesium_polylepis.1